MKPTKKKIRKAMKTIPRGRAPDPKKNKASKKQIMLPRVPKY